MSILYRSVQHSPSKGQENIDFFQTLAWNPSFHFPKFGVGVHLEVVAPSFTILGVFGRFETLNVDVGML